MRVTPKSEQQIREEGLIQPGVYDFEVIGAEDSISKSGNEMMVLKLRVFTNGGERTIRDYLLDAMAFKMRHFCDTVGILDQYESGVVSAISTAGRAGKVKIGIRKDKTGQYPDQNTVLDYVTSDTPTSEAVQEANTSFDADNIPF